MHRAVVLALVAACGGHRHGPPRDDDPDRLYVEIRAEGSQRTALHDGAARGLERVAFAAAATRDADVELRPRVSSLDRVGELTMCSVNILVLRLPEHDLLGIADGSARAQGTDGQAADDCVAGVTASLISGKVRTLLRHRLDAKR